MFSAARWRLTIVFSLVLVLILLAAAVAVYYTTRSLIYQRVDAELADKAKSDLFLVGHDDHGAPHGDEQGGPAGGDKQFDPGGYFFAVVDRSGQVTDRSGSADTQGLAPQSTLDEALEQGKAVTETHAPNG